MDDEPTLVRMTRRRLKALGYVVTAETDAERALETFRTRPSDFDVVVTDYLMPRLAGLDFACGRLAGAACPVHRIGMASGGPSVSCPRCGATNIQSSPVKRSSVPEPQASEYFRGVAGGGQGVDTIQQSLCLRCGCRWIPRTTEERRLRALSGQLGTEAMRVAQAQEIAASAKAVRRRTIMPGKIPTRTWVIAFVMIVVILLALLT